MNLDDFPVQVEMPVAWGQMDAFGHVNNLVYFRFFEDARIACFRRIGIGLNIKQTRVGPILARTSCVFRRPLTYPDTVTAGARIEDVGVDRFTMIYAVFSERVGLAAHGDGRIVVIDYTTGEKAPIPEAIREGIASL